LTCEGPNQQLLDTVTKQCGCMVEWGFHSGFIQIAVATVVFALINLARLMVMRSILMLNWRKLTPGVFVYQANCTERGAILKPAKGKKDADYAELLKRQLQTQIRCDQCGRRRPCAISVAEAEIVRVSNFWRQGFQVHRRLLPRAGHRH
jgi:hypothetical protein